MSQRIRIDLRPGAPNDSEAMWKTEGKENRARRKSWDKSEHYYQVDEPFGPITLREETNEDLVIASGPNGLTVQFITRRGAVKGRHPIVIDGRPGTVRYPSGIFRKTRRYDIAVGDRRWFAERRRLGRVIFGRADTSRDLFCEVMGTGVLARVGGQGGRYRPITGALADEGDGTDMALLTVLRFVGWGALWKVRMPPHGGGRFHGTTRAARQKPNPGV